MSEDEIKPAMSREEWAEVIGRGYDVGELDPDWGPHALAAVALYGQPFGFTWEMVDAVMSVERWDGDAPESLRKLEAVANRISALLPPRESESKP